MILDARPLQLGSSTRGIGSYTRRLATITSADSCVIAATMPDVDLPGDRVIAPAPSADRRFGWLVDYRANADLRRSIGDRIVHTPALDARLGPQHGNVVSVHDTIAWRFTHDYATGPIGRLRLGLEARIARQAERVIAVSHVSALDAERYLGVTRARIAVVPNTFDPGWEDAVSFALAAPRPTHLPDRFLVVAGGFEHLDPRKRLTDPIEALAGLPEDLCVVFSGADGPYRSDLLDHARRAGVERRVVFTGYLPVPQLAELFVHAAAFCFPSAWEGFGIPLINAFYAGAPAIVSRGGALPETAGGAALLHDVGDVAALSNHLLRVLNEPNLAEDLRLAGRERAAAFAPDRMADAYREATAHL